MIAYGILEKLVGKEIGIYIGTQWYMGTLIDIDKTGSIVFKGKYTNDEMFSEIFTIDIKVVDAIYEMVKK